MHNAAKEKKKLMIIARNRAIETQRWCSYEKFVLLHLKK